MHGVGFAIKTKMVQDYQLTPIAISERLMTLRIPLSDGIFMTLISAYAPTLDADEDVKNSFYHQLNAILTKISSKDKILLLGDFNARIGRDNRLWENVMGKQGVGNCNGNGLLLLGLCAEHELFITNTQFRLPNRYKTTWMHPRSKHWHILDYIITRQKDKKDILITKTARNIDDCWTDHRLLFSRLRISLRQKPKTRHQCLPRQKFDTHKLVDASMAENFRNVISDKLAKNPINTKDVEEEWSVLRAVITQSAKETVGFVKAKRPDWFEENNEEILNLINTKREAYLSTLHDPTSRAKKIHFQDLKRNCQAQIRDIKNSWWQQNAQELQSLSDARDLSKFYAKLKEIYGPSRTSTGTLKAADNVTILTDSTVILERWKEHFFTLLNRSSTTAEDFLCNVPQQPPQPWMDMLPTYREFSEALSGMKTGKAPGPDNIPLELIQNGGLPLKTRLFSLILLIWETKNVPDDLKNATIVTIFKKGDRSDCGNYRGISLLSIAGKILAKILLKRLLKVSERILPESQGGFRASRGTTDMIFCVRQLQEKCKEQQQPLFLVFYDLEKAFDSVPRPAMWEVLRRFGCPDRFVSLIQALHDGMSAQVLCQNNTSEAFPVTHGLKQGCVLAPTLFSLYLAAMLCETSSVDNLGVDIRYRFDGGLFNLSRFRSKRLSKVTKITELQYADDNASPALTPEELQRSVNCFKRSYDRFGLTINKQKTKVFAQPAPGTILPKLNITISDTTLEEVDHFSYLGSVLSKQGTSGQDVINRLCAAHAAFGRLSRRVFCNKHLTVHTKLMVYQAVVISTLLYGCETWTLYRQDIKKLEHFHQQKLRSIMKIKWEDHITNISVLEKAGVNSIEAHIVGHRLRWTGHILRMNDDRLPRQMLYSELCTGTRPRGAPLKRYKDQLKQTMKMTNINLQTWEESAMDRSLWRRTISNGVKLFEQEHRSKEENKRLACKLRKHLPRPPPTAKCDLCGRMFHARIGLFSHRKHVHKL